MCVIMVIIVFSSLLIIATDHLLVSDLICIKAWVAVGRDLLKGMWALRSFAHSLDAVSSACYFAAQMP
jgi:hypothetical protein